LPSFPPVALVWLTTPSTSAIVPSTNVRMSLGVKDPAFAGARSRTRISP
jgi:hypothetical protein